jgi:hypothetical protein
MASWVLMLAAFAGCSREKQTAPSHAPVGRNVTAAQLDSLPQLAVTDGRLICQSDGTSPCPVSAAIANWMGDGTFATWELHRQVQIWTPGKTDPAALGENGGGDDKYNYVVSVAAIPSGYEVIDGSPPHVLIYDHARKYLSSRPIPPVALTRAMGFSGTVTFMQSVRASSADSISPATFELREIDSPGDTLGISVVKVQLPWLRMKRMQAVQDSVASPVPLFALLPPFTFTRDSDVVWSTGEQFAIRRQSPQGALRWSIAGDVMGPPVGPDEISKLRSQFLAKAPPQLLASFDSNAAHTGKTHPAIVGLLAAPDGKVLVVGPQMITRDSVTFYTIDDGGAVAAKFDLPKGARVLLFAGDSLVVQRAGANAQPEMRWLMLRKP